MWSTCSGTLAGNLSFRKAVLRLMESYFPNLRAVVGSTKMLVDLISHFNERDICPSKNERNQFSSGSRNFELTFCQKKLFAFFPNRTAVLRQNEPFFVPDRYEVERSSYYKGNLFCSFLGVVTDI